MNILEVYFPNYNKEPSKQENLSIVIKDIDKQVIKKKFEDKMDKLKKFDWIKRLTSIIEMMITKNEKFVKYNLTDTNKSIERWVNDYLQCSFIKECADKYMSERGIKLNIEMDDEKAKSIEITCK